MAAEATTTQPRTDRTPAADALRVQLDAPLPAELAVGKGTALFVCGTCFAPDARIAELALEVDGDVQPVMAHGMPRLDTMRALHPGLDPYATGELERDPASPDDPLFTSYRSGFWGLARIAPRRAGPCPVGLRAVLEDGRAVTAPLAAPAVVGTPEPLVASAPEVAICMATYNPPPDLFARQVASIRAQTVGDWVCVISDDASDPERFAELRAVVAGDPRFVVSRSERRLGFYRNFERALALALAPAGARYVALADQDDDWHPDKLATLLGAIGDARLVYSDARVIGRDGALRSPTYWSRRANNHERLLSLLVANAVTGAASLFPRDLLDDALPFPPGQFAHFHDHWLGLVALATGDIRFVDRPLYDYVQHGGATLGHERANRMPALRERLAGLRRDPRERVRMWRMHYFVDGCRLLQLTAILRLRCWDRMDRGKRRDVARLERADRSVAAVGRLAVRGARDLAARRPETLGAEWMLAHAFGWRRLLAATVRDRPARGLRLDAVPPAALDPAPGEERPASPALEVLSEKLAPLRLRVAADAPARVNVLIPTVDLQHFFGGYIAKLNLALRLARHGRRVRIVTVDPVGTLPRSWREQVEAYAGLAGAFDEVEVAFGREAGLDVAPGDAFVATTWWTAHLAHEAGAELGRERFLYLIQEYEPFTFPMGSMAALAAGSYDLPHTALFSTELLRDYFRRHGIGVYAAGAAAGDRASAAFENAITAIDPPDAAALAARHPRRLLFYARPEPHAARNMFELGVLALRRALAQGAFDGGWTLHGIGTVEAGRTLPLGGGTALEVLPRAAQRDYGALLREHDAGLALMYTPHPSLVPIEMASAGLVTVTNTFENKTAEALAAISPNLLAAPPTVAGVAAALGRATEAAGDAAARVRGSAVRWSRDWDRSFDARLLARVEELLDP